MTRPSHSWTEWVYQGMGNSERRCLTCGYRQDGMEPDSQVPPCASGPVRTTGASLPPMRPNDHEPSCFHDSHQPSSVCSSPECQERFREWSSAWKAYHDAATASGTCDLRDFQQGSSRPFIPMAEVFPGGQWCVTHRCVHKVENGPEEQVR